jgi:hypothetical protein
MGFSLDSSSNTTYVKGNSIDATVTATTGAHTLHVKAWGSAGAVCVTDVAITVSQTATTAPTTSTPTTSTAAPTSADGITVAAPLTNATVASPFTLNASATSCSSKPVVSMGYSLDSSSNTAVVTGQAIGASVTAAAGAHTLKVKSWGSGTSCVADIPITVTSSTSTSTAPASSSNGVTITSPTSGESVTSPFALVASATSCSSQPIASIGYGIDSSTKTVATGGSLNTEISAAAGTHTIQITAWGASGAICNANVSFDVTGSTSATSLVPSDASSVSSIQVLTNWQAQHDAGTPGSSTGAMAMVSSPSLSGNARRFSTTFADNGGERYSDQFADDADATNFLYDAWVYISGTGQSTIGNLEMDTNQVMSNGQTVIYAFQCSGSSGVWEYSKNAGTTASPVVQWMKSSASCNVRNWTPNTWHHVQVYYSRDDSGNVTYHSVWLDGTESEINATVPGAFALGWGQVMVTNFQVDGLGTSGSNTIYLDKLTISRW